MKKRIGLDLPQLYLLLVVISICVLAYFLYTNAKRDGRQEILQSLVDVQTGSKYSLKIDGEITAVYLKVASIYSDEQISNAKEGDKFTIYLCDKKQIATVVSNNPGEKLITMIYPGSNVEMAINGCWVDLPTEFTTTYKRFKEILLPY